MIDITTSFSGGNAVIKQISETEYFITPDQRDTIEDWFYWAFRVDGAEGKTLTFKFDKDWRIGYYGPAISHDYKNWHWMHPEISKVATGFSYTFSDNETSVYFAHDILYRPEYFFEFAKTVGLEVQTLCKSRKGSDIPCFSIGEGETHIVITSRHHACESTGSYVLEGVISELAEHPVSGVKVFCVPMVDYDGVIDGDQGKARAPHDHAREYDLNNAPIYPESAKIREYFQNNQVELCIDLHSPWHFGGENDKVFIPVRSIEKFDDIKAFSRMLEKNITPDAMKYFEKDDHLPNVGWNQVGLPTLANLGLNRSKTSIAFTIETCYFGLADNIFEPDKARAFGRCVARTINEYFEK